MDFLVPIQRAAAQIPQAPIARLLTAGLVACSLYVLALIVWLLVPQPESNAPTWRPNSQTQLTEQAASVDGLLALQLFGKADKKSQQNQSRPVERNLINDAPKTSLRILLTGLVASSQEEMGIAIVESGGSQETYGIGDKIKSTNASLHEVYADRAIILNQGRYETLMLDGMEYTREVSEETQRLRQTPERKDVRNNAQVQEALGEARQAMLTDPGKLTDFIRISPVRDREAGGVKGYRLNPGNKGRELFIQSGLKPNDLAVSINGYDLTDLGQAAQLMNELPELTEASVMVERDGQLTQVLFAMPTQ